MTKSKDTLCVTAQLLGLSTATTRQITDWHTVVIHRRGLQDYVITNVVKGLVYILYHLFIVT